MKQKKKASGKVLKKKKVKSPKIPPNQAAMMRVCFGDNVPEYHKKDTDCDIDEKWYNDIDHPMWQCSEDELND